jgi:hypothetical protein
MAQHNARNPRASKFINERLCRWSAGAFPVKRSDPLWPRIKANRKPIARSGDTCRKLLWLINQCK